MSATAVMQRYIKESQRTQKPASAHRMGWIDIAACRIRGTDKEKNSDRECESHYKLAGDMIKRRWWISGKMHSKGLFAVLDLTTDDGNSDDKKEIRTGPNEKSR